MFVGETHAMRVDVTGSSGARVSAVQAHESFRRVVGQSCAEFALSLLAARGLLLLPADGANSDDGEEDGARWQDLPASGVFTPEELYAEGAARGAILERLLAVPGTINAGYARYDAADVMREGELAGDSDVPASPLAALSKLTDQLKGLNELLDKPILDTGVRGGPLEPFKRFARLEPETASAVASAVAIGFFAVLGRLLLAVITGA